MRSNARSGFTMLEVALSITLLAIVTVKISGAISSATDVAEEDAAQVTLETQARRVLRQIGFAVMGSHPGSLVPDITRPNSTSDLRFQVSLGVEDGEVVWSEPEMVAMEELQQQIYWSDNPEAADERRVIWTNLVAPFLEGELPNGLDDNGNGLIDEKGLSFTIDRNSVDMKLTLERVRDDGTVVHSTVENVVTCRNTINGWGTAER